MSAPTIEVGIALGVGAVTDFILDDPIRGVLDSTFTLGTGYTDVTSSTFRCSITRGRFSELTRPIEAGDIIINLNNEDRAFDPAHLGSPYVTNLAPGRGLQIKAGGKTIVTGFVEDWNLEYDVSGRSVAMCMATDALGVLAAGEFDEWTSTKLTAGGKLSDICNRAEIDWPATLRDFDDGVEALQSDAVSWGSNALNYAQLVAQSELGYLFASSDGMLTFRDRLIGSSPSSVSFSDDGGTFESVLTDTDGDPLLDEFGEPLTANVDTIAYESISATVGSERLYSRVGVDREGGINQTATVADPAAWRLENGPLRSLTIPITLLASDARSLALAQFLLSLYDTPRYMVSDVAVELATLSASQQDSVLAIDIASVIDVSYTPNGVGAPIIQRLVVQGIRHDVAPMTHTVSFSTIPAPSQHFRLDSAVYGVLDGIYKLAF